MRRKTAWPEGAFQMTSRLRGLLFAGAAIAIAAPGLAVAADAGTEVDEVVVTGHIEETLPQTLSQYGNRVEIVTDQRVQDGGYVDVGQVLASEVPGLSLIPQSGPFSYNTASLQGSRTNEILYLVDGVRISNRLYNTTPPLDTVPAHMVQRIEVLQGGQGLFFGTQAVAGVINIVTRDFTDEPHGRVEAGGDSNEGWNLNGYASGALGPNKVVVFASHDEAQGFQPFPTVDYQPSGTDRHRGYRLDSVGGKYAIEPTDGLRLSASYTHTEGHVDFARPLQSIRAVNERNEEIAWVKLDYDVNDRLGFYVKGYWHDWKSHYDEVDNSPAGPVVVDDHEVWTFQDKGINAVGRYVAMPGLEVWGGYDYQRYGGHDDVLLIERRNETANAVFGQIRITPEMIPNAHIAAGVRRNFIKTADDATVWNVSGQYDLSASLFVRGTAGTSFRLPDAESLFANDPIFNGEIGNANLKPERSRNLNASLGGQMAGVSWELIGFYRQTKDLISLDGETPDPDVFTFINLPDKVRARGVEAVVSAQPSQNVSLQGSFTHARTRQTGQGRQLAGVPKDTAQAVFDLHPADKTYGAGATVNWVGSVYDNVASGFGPRSRGHYVVVDLNGYVALGRYGRLGVRLENVLDEDYFTRINRATKDTGGSYLVHYRGVPRTVHVAYSYSF
jgi:vitamin B12 transporter